MLMRGTGLERAGRIAQVRDHMREKKLTQEDLLIGGEDLRSPDPKVSGKARAVERAWELMARTRHQARRPRLARFGHFGTAPRSTHGFSARRRRHRKSNLKRQ